jgi:hypothetical protein
MLKVALTFGNQFFPSLLPLNIDLSEADFIKTSVVLLAVFSVEHFSSF